MLWPRAQVRTFGRNGCTARVLQLKLVRPSLPAAAEDAGESNGSSRGSESGSESDTSSSASSCSNSSGLALDEVMGVLRVKPVRVHMNAVTQRLENIELLYCPPDRVVVVDVPLRLINDEMAPGVRKGGWMCMYK